MRDPESDPFRSNTQRGDAQTPSLRLFTPPHQQTSLPPPTTQHHQDQHGALGTGHGATWLHPTIPLHIITNIQDISCPSRPLRGPQNSDAVHIITSEFTPRPSQASDKSDKLRPPRERRERHGGSSRRHVERSTVQFTRNEERAKKGIKVLSQNCCRFIHM